MEWQSLTLELGRKDVIPCDCCRKRTVSIEGEVFQNSDFRAWYVARWSEGHPDIPLHITIYVGDWSDGAPKDKRWGIAIEVLAGDGGGCRLLDWSDDARAGNSIFTMLDREELVGSDFEPELWAIADAIVMKDDRLERQVS